MEKTKFKDFFFTVFFLFAAVTGTETTNGTTQTPTDAETMNSVTIAEATGNATSESETKVAQTINPSLMTDKTDEYTTVTDYSTLSSATTTFTDVTTVETTAENRTFTSDFSLTSDISSVSSDTVTSSESTDDVMTDTASVSGETATTEDFTTYVLTDISSPITDETFNETEASSLFPVTDQVTETTEKNFTSASDATVESLTKVTDEYSSLNTESSTASALSSQSPSVDFSSVSDSITDVIVAFTQNETKAETDSTTVAQTYSSSEISTENEQQQSTNTEEITTDPVTSEVETEETSQQTVTSNVTMEMTTGATTFLSNASEVTATLDLSKTPLWTTEELSTLKDSTNQESTVVESSTTQPTSTTIRSTTTAQSLDNEPNLDGKTTVISLTLLWPDLIWRSDLSDTSSERYQEYTAELETKMYEIYRSTYGFVTLSVDEFRELKQNRNARKKRQVGSKGIFSTMKNSYSLEAALINDNLIADNILDSLPDLSKMTLASTNVDQTYINETLTESLNEQLGALENLSLTICGDDNSLCAPSEYCLPDPTKEIGIACQYKCFQYDCKEKQGISNAYCYVDELYEPSCGCNPDTLDTGSNCLSQWWIVGISIGVAVILIGVFTTIIIVLVIKARRNHHNSSDTETFIFEDQKVFNKKKQKLRRLSETEDSLTPAYDENYHDNGAVENGKCTFKNRGYDKDSDRLSLDSNDPQYQDISKMLPLQSFSPRLDLVNTKESFLIPRATLENEMDSSYFN